MKHKLDNVDITSIENHKIITDKELKRDLSNLLKFDGKHNSNNFFGNPFLYHFQLKNLLKCKRENSDTIYDVYNDADKWNKLIENTIKRNRNGKTASGNVWECFRINLGSVVMFKSTTAKYLYKKYKAKHVLDPTAGWGGRLLGAWACDIDYTGIDTNTEMINAYKEMNTYLKKENDKQLFKKKTKQQMIWKSCLDVDFSKIDYDFVLTSPPYINLEIYEHMDTWSDDEQFYKGFLIPLWDKCAFNIKKGGTICFNISPKMYDDAVSFGLKICDMEENLIQQLGQKTGKKKQDKIYIWKC